jgi:hypothetical protein
VYIRTFILQYSRKMDQVHIRLRYDKGFACCDAAVVYVPIQRAGTVPGQRVCVEAHNRRGEDEAKHEEHLAAQQMDVLSGEKGGRAV